MVHLPTKVYRIERIEHEPEPWCGCDDCSDGHTCTATLMVKDESGRDIEGLCDCPGGRAEAIRILREGVV
jgi:hypothetical protein